MPVMPCTCVAASNTWIERAWPAEAADHSDALVEHRAPSTVCQDVEHEVNVPCESVFARALLLHSLVQPSKNHLIARSWFCRGSDCGPSR